MRDTHLTVIGHAALHVDTGAATVLVDPWLVGSAFWRSWWHLPAPAPLRDEWLRPDYVYLSHHHFDHFHYPSMRKIDRSTRVLIPEFGVDVMRSELLGLGFTSVTELRHGVPVPLGDDTVVASYQYGTDDTLLVIRCGDTVIVDVNDCKIRGRAMAQVRRDFGPATFMFKSHSWAQAYPWCYDADDPVDLALLTPEVYLNDFVRAAVDLGARYAVPFGSGVAFLQHESSVLNPHAITGEVVQRRCANALREHGTEIVLMQPGDGWSRATGLHLSGTLHDRDAELEQLAAIAAPKIAEQDHIESGRRFTIAAATDYFAPLVRVLPAIAARRALPRPVAIRWGSGDDQAVVLDFAGRRILSGAADVARCASVIDVVEGLLSLAVEQRIVHLLHGAARVRVHLQRGGLREDTIFWMLLMLWELGYLPLPRSLNARAARVMWLRRREALGYVTAAVRGRGPLHERMAESFASVSDDALTPDSAGAADERG